MQILILHLDIQRYIQIIYQSVKEQVATTFCQCLGRRGLSFSLNPHHFLQSFFAQ